MASALAIRVFLRLPGRMRYAVVRLSGPRYTVGAQVIVRRPDGRILLVQQTYRRLLFLPGGTLKRGESVLDGAGRELREETGLTTDLVPLGHTQVRPDSRWATFYALADVDEATAESAAPRGGEISGLVWAHPDRLPEVAPGVHAAMKHIRTAPVALGVRPES